MLKNVFFTAMTFFGCNVINVNPLKCVSMNNQECKIRAEITDNNSNEASFYLYSIEVNKCSGSCNNVNDPYAELWYLWYVYDIMKKIIVKVFNPMSRTNETRHIE